MSFTYSSLPFFLFSSSFSPHSLHFPLFLHFRCPVELSCSLSFLNSPAIAAARQPCRQRSKVWTVKAAYEDNSSSSALEEEIYEFMQNSARPDCFPTKNELVAAGRSDLVHAIASRGGWLAFGWDLDDDDDDDDEMIGSLSGRELESIEDGGIEGILSRLEKERSLSLELNVEEKDSRSNFDQGGPDELVVSRSRSLAGSLTNRIGASPESDINMAENFGSVHLNNREHEDVNPTDSSPDTWKSWSLQRNGFHPREFEAAEIVPTNSDHKLENNILKDDILSKESENREKLENIKDDVGFDKNQIRLRLKNLEADLASTLHTLRYRANGDSPQKCEEGYYDELNNLSDTWEFQQNEIMKAQDKLRSIRAKLSVLEGKLTFEIIEAQKALEEKERKLHAAQNALSLLRTTCIIWSYSASEVFLAGSFDGWTSQRRMEKSSSDFFALNLKLYPGRYEIKFIVDGVWKIDPVLPIVHENGHENNLLIIN